MAYEYGHGNITAYSMGRCRCDLCKAAWAAYHRPRSKAISLATTRLRHAFPKEYRALYVEACEELGLTYRKMPGDA